MHVQEAEEFGNGANYTSDKYKVMADEFYRKWFEKHPGSSPSEVEAAYWQIVETAHLEVTVEYGNDLSTKKYASGFPRVPKGVSRAASCSAASAKESGGSHLNGMGSIKYT